MKHVSIVYQDPHPYNNSKLQATEESQTQFSWEGRKLDAELLVFKYVTMNHDFIW